MNIRVGQGYDVHQLVEGRDLILGGVNIPFEKACWVILMLMRFCMRLPMPVGCGRFGRYRQSFPGTAAEFKDADSRMLLRKAYQSVQALGWKVVNVDTTVIAQKPKLAPHIPAMRAISLQIWVCLKLREHQG